MKRLIFTLGLLFLAAFLSPSFADAQADLKQGHFYLSRGSLSEALYCLTQALAEPDFILKDYAQYEVGEVYFKNGNYLLAADEFGKVNRESQIYPRASFKKAECYKLAEDHESARLAYKHYFTNFPDEDKAAQAGYELASLQEKAGQFEAAYRTYNQVDLYYPLSPYAKASRLAIKKLSRKYHLAAYQTNPQDLYKKGLDYLRADRYDAAEAVFFRLARDYPKSKYAGEAFLMMGRAELWGDKLNDAISHIQKSLSYTPARKKARNLYYLGRAYGRRGKYDYGKVYMKQVLDYYPQSSYADDACYYLGLYFEYSDEDRSAISTYTYLMEKYPQSNYADNAIFRGGILSYKAADLEISYRIFGQASVKGIGEETPKCLLWWGKVAQRLGKQDESAGIYYYLTQKFDHSYASYRAREALYKLGYRLPASKDITLAEQEKDLSEIDGSEEDDRDEIESLVGAFKQGNHNLPQDAARSLARYEALMALDLTEYAVLEAKEVLSSDNRSSRELSQITMGKIMHKVGEYRTPISYTEGKIRNAVLAGKPQVVARPFWELAYPKGFYDQVLKYSNQNTLDPYLTLAVIREESRFNPAATSRSRAHGLMQIIPSTGRILAKQLGISPFYRKQMYNVDINLKMGTYYLKNLIKRFDGNIALALAGYNGGPVRVKKWVNNRYGGDMKNLDIDEFIEYIPLRETRNYVQKVLGSYYEYKRLYE